MGRRRALLLLGGAVLLVLVGGGTAAGFYADLHWFRSLGFEDRFWKLEVAGWVAWAAVFASTAAVVGVVAWDAIGKGGPVQVRRRLGDLEIAEAIPDRWLKWALAGGVAVVGFLVASPFAGPISRQVLFALEAQPWGRPDAILGQDPRFYVFFLPLLRTAWSVLLAILVWAAIALVSLLLLSGRIRATEQGIEVDGFARRRLVYLAAGVLLLVAGHFGLSVYEAVGGGPVTYVDVKVEIPARRILSVLALVGAGALVYGERTEGWRGAVTVLTLLAVVWPAGTIFLPGLLQRFRVEPNELELERPYIDAEVEATRAGFGLHEVNRVPYEITPRQPPVEKLRRYTSGLPLWDERPLKATYDQLQGLLAYHEFPDVDADRYGAVGEKEQVAVGVREFAPGRLAASARTWQNLHLRYTHGTGAVVTAVDRASEGGEPQYFLRDIPPEPAADAPGEVRMEAPKFYFGERTTQYVMLPRDSFPEEGDPTGVDLGGAVQRALFAWALESKNILLRNPGTGEPRLMWRREVVSRVRSVVPFLLVDPDIYPVLHQGRVKWIVELYAASTRYPLSRPHDIGGRGVNYVRSVAKGVVDGVTGRVSLYTVDPDEPLIATYRRVFPDVFQPLGEMPAGLREHLRYPQPLFRTQARVLEAYHMTEADVFYQKQDLWSLGREVYDQNPTPVEPYFLLMPFPGGEGQAGERGSGAAGGAQQEFLLTLPFTPRNRDNLSSFLMARNDGEHYGELWLYDVSGQQQVFGPRQVEVQIDQDPVISQQLSLWQQRGSRSIRGHLLLVPVEGYLLYVEPLFLVAEDREGAAPGLKRVIAAAGDRVAMGQTLDEALQRLTGQMGRAVPTVEDEAPDERAAARQPDEARQREEGRATAEPRDGTRLEELRRLLEQADAALRRGDFERFGQLWERIRSTAGAGASPDTAVTAGGP